MIIKNANVPAATDTPAATPQKPRKMCLINIDTMSLPLRILYKCMVDI